MFLKCTNKFQQLIQKKPQSSEDLDEAADKMNAEPENANEIKKRSMPPLNFLQLAQNQLAGAAGQQQPSSQSKSKVIHKKSILMFIEQQLQADFMASRKKDGDKGQKKSQHQTKTFKSVYEQLYKTNHHKIEMYNKMMKESHMRKSTPQMIPPDTLRDSAGQHSPKLQPLGPPETSPRQVSLQHLWSINKRSFESMYYTSRANAAGSGDAQLIAPDSNRSKGKHCRSARILHKAKAGRSPQKQFDHVNPKFQSVTPLPLRRQRFDQPNSDYFCSNGNPYTARCAYPQTDRQGAYPDPPLKLVSANQQQQSITSMLESYDIIPR